MNEEQGCCGLRAESFWMLIAGAAIGAGAALLLAPHSGRHTRRRIRRQAEAVQEYLEEAIEELQEQAREFKEAAEKAVRDVRKSP